MRRPFVISVLAIPLLIAVIYWSRSSAQSTVASQASDELAAALQDLAEPRAESDASVQPPKAPQTSTELGTAELSQESAGVLGKILYVPREPSHLAAIESIKGYFPDQAKAKAFVALLDETCALEQGHALEEASVRSELFEAIATQQPATSALELSDITDDYVAKLTATIAKSMELIPVGPDRAPFKTPEFKKLIADQCPSVIVSP